MEPSEKVAVWNDYTLKYGPVMGLGGTNTQLYDAVVKEMKLVLEGKRDPIGEDEFTNFDTPANADD